MNLAKNKTVFFIVAFLVMAVLIGFFIWLNLRQSNNSTPNIKNTTSQNKSTDSTTDQPKQAAFDESRSLEKFDNEPIGLPSSIFFIPGGKVGFLDSNFKLRIDKQEVTDSPEFLPQSIYNSNDGIILNDVDKSQIYLKTGKFKNFPTEVSQVNPFLISDDFNLDFTSGYVFVQRTSEASKFNIIQSPTVDLKSNQTILTEFKLPNTLNNFELKVLNKNIYLLFYENSNRTGQVKIQLLKDKKLQEIINLPKVESLNFSENRIMYTTLLEKPTETTNYQSSIIDFTNKPSGETKLLDVNNALAAKKVMGSLLADRCSFGTKNNLFCLVKENPVNIDLNQERDFIVEINLTNNQIALVSNDILFSAYNIYVGSNGSIYILNQQNNLLYQLKT